MIDFELSDKDREVLDELARELQGRCRLFAPIRRTTVFDQAAVAAVPTFVSEPEHRALAGYHEIVQEIASLVSQAHKTARA